MGRTFAELAFTPLVEAQQLAHGSRRAYERMELAGPPDNALGPDEQAFLALRDSFYMASTSETGWPYMQHRGGSPGFVHILRPTQIAFADLRGNKQYISRGNLEHDARIALFFMDYPNQTRLKILGRAEIREGTDADTLALLAALRPIDPSAVVERALVITVAAFDWNCPQHITPRYTADELEPALAPMRARLQALEDENRGLRARLSQS